MLERKHPAPRGAEEVDAIQAELFADGVDLLAEHRHGPLDVLRPIRVAAPDLVVQDDRTLSRETLERPEVVMRRPRAAVQREQRDRSGAELSGHLVPGAVATEVDKAL